MSTVVASQNANLCRRACRGTLGRIHSVIYVNCRCMAEKIQPYVIDVKEQSHIDYLRTVLALTRNAGKWPMRLRGG